jgi:PAS domain S-box-containing protein
MKKPLKILILEDNPSDAKLVKIELKKTEKEFESRVVQDEENFLKELEAFQPDLILSDYAMPQFTGLDALDIAKKKCPEIPFIIVTGSLNEEIAIKCMRWGAWDYVIKDKLVHLGHAVKNAIKLKAENEKKKLSEKELQENEQELNAIFNGARDGIALLDKTGKILRINKFIVEIGGFTEKEIVGKRFSALKMFPLKSMSKMITVFSKLIKGEEISYEVEVNTKKGEKKIVQFHNSLLKKDGKVEGVIAILRDITERKQAEEVIKESEEKYRSLVETIEEGIGNVDENETFIFVNQAAADIFGYTKKEMIGKNLKELTSTDMFQEIFKHTSKRKKGNSSFYELPNT